MHKIKIGSIMDPSQVDRLPKLMELGFETFSVMFFTSQEYDMPKVAHELMQALEGTGCGISNLCMYGNTLTGDDDAKKAREYWEMLIDAAPLFNTDLVCGFAGRVPDVPVPESIPRYKEVFAPLAERADKNGVRIAFENCEMGGDWQKGNWNIAFCPRAWEMMFDALPAKNIGLQWEPCHQMVQLIDPIPQLRKWADKIFALHGKDAYIAWDVLKEHGTHSGIQYAWHRTTGFGDTNWTEIMTILMMAGYTGTIDIEGHHDPIYKGELELTGQVHALNYLKLCRGGVFHANL